MADYRPIHTQMWMSDEWFNELPIDGKLLWAYLLTNPRSSVSGLYPLPLKFASTETSISRDRIAAILDEFAHAGKAFYHDGYVWVVKMRDYQSSGGEKIIRCIEKDLEKMDDTPLKQLHIAYYAGDRSVIAYEYAMDSLSIQYPSRARGNETKQNNTKQEHVPPDGGTLALVPPEEPGEELDPLTEDTTAYSPAFEKTWAAYPRKVKKSAAYRSYSALMKKARDKAAGESTLHSATMNYAHYCEQRGFTPDKIMHGSTFFGPDKPFQDFLNRKAVDQRIAEEMPANAKSIPPAKPATGMNLEEYSL